MAAITKTFTAIADSAVDADSPLTTNLITALRDNSTHLREWLGASYTAGAVQDHNHDGVNSAAIEVGPNLLRNGSFESDTTGWTFTNYTGGTNAIYTTAPMHGAKAAAITSTVLANGGGEALSGSFIPIAAGGAVQLAAWLKASAANISAKVQLLWYDKAQAAISTTDMIVYTNTPTTATLLRQSVAAPANACFCKLKIIGGVPASGSGTGTVYFDGLQLTSIVDVHGFSVLVGSATDTFVVPPGVFSVFVVAIGGGGGGGGGSSTVTTSGGAGGNGFVDPVVVAVTPGASISRTAGGGGAGGGPNTNGSAGGASSFGASATGAGGLGGIGNAIGGVNTGGRGFPGGWGTPGAGGVNANGSAGTGIGAGGGGAGSQAGSGNTGGAGSAGAVLVWW